MFRKVNAEAGSMASDTQFIWNIILYCKCDKHNSSYTAIHYILIVRFVTLFLSIHENNTGRRHKSFTQLKTSKHNAWTHFIT